MLVVLGEAPGSDEERTGIPFVGQAGKTLDELMREAGLDRREWHVLNTFIERPPENDLRDVRWTLNKTEYRREFGCNPPSSPPPLKKRYLRPEHHWQLAELSERLRAIQPDLILAMGATALWALTAQDAITSYRGNFFLSPFGSAIATFHPAAVLYMFQNRPVLWADLVKVRKWLDGTLMPPMKRRLWFDPSFEEIETVYKSFRRRPLDLLGVDIETAPSIAQITTISFSTEREGICIPFWNKDELVRERQNYWARVEDERIAWRWVEKFSLLPNPKVCQNGLYDSQYLMDAPLDIRLRNYRHDTAIMAHSYQPELQKALGFLSSIFLNEPSWKQMRQSAKDVNKADE